jgi:hypothetical protein
MGSKGSVLSDTRANLSRRCGDHLRIHGLHLSIHVRLMVTTVIDEDHAHDGPKIRFLLVIDGEPGLVQEILADTALGKIDIVLAEV